MRGSVSLQEYVDTVCIWFQCYVRIQALNNTPASRAQVDYGME